MTRIEIEIDLRLAGHETLHIQFGPQPAGDQVRQFNFVATARRCDQRPARLQHKRYRNDGQLVLRIELDRDAFHRPTRTPRNVTGAPTDNPAIESSNTTAARIDGLEQVDFAEQDDRRQHQHDPAQHEGATAA